RLVISAEGLAEDINIVVERWVLSPILRFVVAGGRGLPFRCHGFFWYCEEALLLKRVAREIEFIHRLLRDYFALRDLRPQLQAKERDRQLEAIRALGYQGISAIDTLAELAGDRVPDVRAAAIAALGRIAAPEIVAHLERALADDALEVRQAAVQGLRNV